ncbi:hypothetical protein EW15_0788 [Prochlorococcus sp. MIT 0801]|nr:hypothetical protein EW15_0788 [Prochlorococcus sp. MIT 0801]
MGLKTRSHQSLKKESQDNTDLFKQKHLLSITSRFCSGDFDLLG